MKKLFTLIMLLLVTGCTCSYELSIQDSSIYETLKINGVTTEIPVDVDLVNLSDTNYKKEVVDDTVTYTTSYNLETYKKTNFLSCFESYNIQTTDDKYIIRTGKNFTCLPYQYNDYDELKYDELEIKIKTNHKVVNHNASKVENNTYYWYITKENINNADIYFEIEKNVNKPYVLAIAVFMLILLIVGVIVYFVVKSKSEKSNKI